MDTTSNPSSPTPAKLPAGVPFPPLQWQTVQGDALCPAREQGWRVLVVYRGKHCPLCKGYLDTLQRLLPEFEAAGIRVAAVSADPRDKAEAQVAECGWTFPVGWGLAEHEMRQLGLYVSDPRSADETDRRFAEPGLFVLNPAGEVQIVDVSNAPFARPDLASLLKGVQFVASKNYPIRGRA